MDVIEATNESWESVRAMPLSRFWRIHREVMQRPSLPSLARAYFGIEEPAAETVATSDDELAAMAAAFGVVEGG